jgi:hypothetical protein
MHARFQADVNQGPREPREPDHLHASCLRALLGSRERTAAGARRARLLLRLGRVVPGNFLAGQYYHGLHDLSFPIALIPCAVVAASHFVTGALTPAAAKALPLFNLSPRTLVLLTWTVKQRFLEVAARGSRWVEEVAATWRRKERY